MEEDTNILIDDNLTSEEVRFLNKLDGELIGDKDNFDISKRKKKKKKNKKDDEDSKRNNNEGDSQLRKSRSRSNHRLRSSSEEYSQEDLEVSTVKRKKTEIKNVELGSSRNSGRVFSSSSNNNVQVSSPVSGQVLYNRLDKGPFIVYIKKKIFQDSDSMTKVVQDDDPKKKKSLMNIEVARLLKLFGIKKFNLLEKFSRNIWQITFESFEEANSALVNEFLKKNNWESYIPREKLFCKGIVREVPLDVDIKELLSEINNYFNNPRSVNAYRLRRKVFSEGKVDWCDTFPVCVTFRSSQVPKAITLWNCKVKVDYFIPNIRQCFKCGQTGHNSNFCEESKEKCLYCGQDKHGNFKDCNRTPKCVNCNGEHKSLSKDCIVVIKLREISQMMGRENISFINARNKYEDDVKRNLLPERSLHHFPRLSPNIEEASYASVVMKDDIKKKLSADRNPREKEISEENKIALEELLEAIPQVPDITNLWPRLWKVISLHISLNNGALQKQP
ncbi:uncharacterized protein [Chelonus insularis]|uniref:uncharacterized protein n=1 Tax=Chelonus insularis TaxID=460826 RepID=UPI001588C990|nr:uncharacterized protein LOC118064751 [Chelonus insularis]